MMGQGIEDAKAMLRYLMKKRELEQAQEQKAFIEGGGRLGDGSETPIPGAAEAKKGVDGWLTENVVEPMARRGYGDAGAAIATVPSVIADVVMPDTVGELAMPPPIRGKGGKVISLGEKRTAKELEAMRRLKEDAPKRQTARELAEEIAREVGNRPAPPKQSAREILEKRGEDKAGRDAYREKKARAYENSPPSRRAYMDAQDVAEEARKLLDPKSQPLSDLNQPIGGARSPFHYGYKPLKGKEEAFAKLKEQFEALQKQGDELYEAEVRASDEQILEHRKKFPNGSPPDAEGYANIDDYISTHAEWKASKDAADAKKAEEIRAMMRNVKPKAE